MGQGPVILYAIEKNIPDIYQDLNVRVQRQLELKKIFTGKKLAELLVWLELDSSRLKR